MLLCIPLVLVAGCGAGTTTGAGGSAAPVTTGPAPAAPTSGGSVAATPGEKAVAAEQNPPGDIPDNISFVVYTNPTGRYSLTHPEGWTEMTNGESTTFTDKLNGVHVETGMLTAAPTVDSATQQDLPVLTRSQAAFELRGVTAATEPAGAGVRIVYRRNSAPDPVTGRKYRDEVERYELVSHGREVVVELSGAVGSDNVDAYRRMITSLTVG